MLIGYIRVSTNEQNTALQRNELKKVLCMLSRDDTLVVWKLDRLGRSMR